MDIVKLKIVIFYIICTHTYTYIHKYIYNPIWAEKEKLNLIKMR